MKLESRNFIEEDYNKFIQPITKENMQDLFIKNFGGWSDDVSKKKFFEIVKNGFVKLFFLEDEFVGYVSCNTEKNNPDSFLINDIHIKKDFQRKGFGTEILNQVITEANKQNKSQLKVFVFKNNPSIKFYEKRGFKEEINLEKSNTSVMIKTIDQP